MKNTKGITVKKADDMNEWYGQVVTKADVADYAPVRGCMIIKPRGFSLWQSIQEFFDKRIKKIGVENAYFPLFIPESFFQKEAEHAEGFAPEVAWIEKKSDQEERLAVRPTSETIIYDSYSKWIRSWRDLPLRMNQWCNIVRWEVKDTKIFLRSREFLWQEGHCVYETEKECQKETLQYLDLYRKVAEELLAIPVILGKKTKSETFPGAERSYTIEGFMPDGKALQMGTSHMLGQNFAKMFEIKYLGREGEWELPWQNSWGISTRLLGAIILMHGDDKGLVLPPRMVDRQVAIVPIFVKDDKQNDETLAASKNLAKLLAKYSPILDDRDDYSAGWKFNEHELHGVPIRVEIGPRDVASNQVVVARRDTGEKISVPIPEVKDEIRRLLDEIQMNLFNKAKKIMTDSMVDVNTWEEFLQADKDSMLILAPHCSDVSCEESIKEETQGVTGRCIPLRGKKPNKPCVKCGKPAKYNCYFARAY